MQESSQHSKHVILCRFIPFIVSRHEILNVSLPLAGALTKVQIKQTGEAEEEYFQPEGSKKAVIQGSMDVLLVIQ